MTMAKLLLLPDSSCYSALELPELQHLAPRQGCQAA